MKPFFSVIIPLYNKEKFIEATLKSVLNQNFKNFEVIIVDDGSSDSSFKVVSQIKDSKTSIFKQENKGVSFARNLGIEKAKGKYIALLDADDYWHTNHLLELKKLIDTFPKAGLFCNNYEVYYTDTIYKPAKFNFDFKEDCLIVKDFFKASVTNSVAWTSGVAFTKEKFNAVGGFNTILKTAQDLDLWIKLALKYDVAFNPIITMSYKIHVDNSLSKSKYNDIRYEFINNFTEEEKTNPSLKLYLDINRFAVALRCKMNDEEVLYKKLKSEIDFNNLNYKQKFLLNCPKWILKLAKGVHGLLIKNGVYFSANK
ncbi:glycosyltransferase family 2 protein [uncultured Algibacter sp.]|uniref:glycosyltransferase family 2 protein n=1 Tax=uncultured Algibacter sp. TaxID=298659 RepID=UPI00261D20FA|nr:glycosyltransferase family 2 protein [uncultured Algibacter sp.]